MAWGMVLSSVLQKPKIKAPKLNIYYINIYYISFLLYKYLLYIISTIEDSVEAAVTLMHASEYVMTAPKGGHFPWEKAQLQHSSFCVVAHWL